MNVECSLHVLYITETVNIWSYSLSIACLRLSARLTALAGDVAGVLRGDQRHDGLTCCSTYTPVLQSAAIRAALGKSATPLLRPRDAHCDEVFLTTYPPSLPRAFDTFPRIEASRPSFQMAEESPEIQAALRNLDRELEVCTFSTLVVSFCSCMIHDRRAISPRKGKRFDLIQYPWP